MQAFSADYWFFWQLTSITRRILRVLMYLCLVLALEIILWYMWNQMARDSLETPIEQMLRAMLIRVHLYESRTMGLNCVVAYRLKH